MSHSINKNDFLLQIYPLVYFITFHVAIIKMDRFLKWLAPDSGTPIPNNKNPKGSDKEGNKSPEFRTKEFGPLYYYSGGKFFCRTCNTVVDHHRKFTIKKHID